MKVFQMPLHFVDEPLWPSNMEPPSLQYSAALYEVPGDVNAQPVLRDRTLLTPQVDLNKYRCKAVLDWIEFRLETKGTHQAINIQRFAETILDSDGSSSSVYVSGPFRQSHHIGPKFESLNLDYFHS